MMRQEEKLAYPVSFKEVQERHNLKQSALSYRIKTLGLKTQRRGRNTFLSINQLDLLEKLNNFLKENPNQTIEDFIDSRMGNESLINQQITNESPMNHASIGDAPGVHHSWGDVSVIHQSLGTKQSTADPAFEQWEKKMSATEQCLTSLLEYLDQKFKNNLTDESLVNNLISLINRSEKNLQDLERENQELSEENDRLKKERDELRHTFGELFAQHNQLKSENQVANVNLINSQSFYLPFHVLDLIQSEDGVYVKTKYKTINEATQKLQASTESRPCR